MSTAQRISEWSRQLGGNGGVALYYSDHTRHRKWKAVTEIAPPRVRGRYLEALGDTPDDALNNLIRSMPALSNPGVQT